MRARFFITSCCPRENIADIPPTVGFNIKTIQVDDLKVNVWDVGGQKSIRTFWRNYFDTTDGLVWVIDSSDRERLIDCRNELGGLLKEERLSGASLLVVANKQDLPGALSPGEIADILDFNSIKLSRHCAVLRCSALIRESVTDCLNWIIHDIGDRIYTLR
jgi:ADP-ribosylation factor-like protein 2